eukprot:1153605-Prymnesium_polylepis.1
MKESPTKTTRASNWSPESKKWGDKDCAVIEREYRKVRILSCPAHHKLCSLSLLLVGRAAGSERNNSWVQWPRPGEP